MRDTWQIFYSYCLETTHRWTMHLFAMTWRPIGVFLPATMTVHQLFQRAKRQFAGLFNTRRQFRIEIAFSSVQCKINAPMLLTIHTSGYWSMNNDNLSAFILIIAINDWFFFFWLKLFFNNDFQQSIIEKYSIRFNTHFR